MFKNTTTIIATGFILLWVTVAYAFTPLEKASQIETVLQGQDYCGYQLDGDHEQKLFSLIGLSSGKTSELVWEHNLSVKAVKAFEGSSTGDRMCAIAWEIINAVGLFD